MSYIGTTDPDGWVICDGVNRTATDNRYANIYSLLNTYNNVGTNTQNSITPPKLTSSFIYGNASTSTSTISTGGRQTVTLSTSELPAHNHGVNDSGHAHYSVLGTNSNGSNALLASKSYSGVSGSSGEYWGVTNSTSNAGSTTSNTTGISIANTGGGSSFSILPPYTTMNYIMKY